MGQPNNTTWSVAHTQVHNRPWPGKCNGDFLDSMDLQLSPYKFRPSDFLWFPSTVFHFYESCHEPLGGAFSFFPRTPDDLVTTYYIYEYGYEATEDHKYIARTYGRTYEQTEKFPKTSAY